MRFTIRHLLTHQLEALYYSVWLVTVLCGVTAAVVLGRLALAVVLLGVALALCRRLARRPKVPVTATKASGQAL